MGAVESELGQVMLAYTVLFVFSAKTLNCCDLMLLLLVLEFMQVCIGPNFQNCKSVTNHTHGQSSPTFQLNCYEYH